MRFNIGFILIGFAFFFAFCKNDSGATDKKSVTIQNGHTRMVAILDSIAGYSDPNMCYNLNGKKLRLSNKSGSDRPLKTS
jgi:hypothetical protein